jgi:hypothetical protein
VIGSFGYPFEDMAWLETQLDPVSARDGGGLATEEFPDVLAMEISREWRQTKIVARNGGTDKNHVE